MSAPTPSESAVLARLGRAVRARRRHLELSQRELAARSGLSPRFLAQLEAGSGNVSYLNLRRLARALEIEMLPLVERAEAGGGGMIALLGMRGAGKSTLGRLLADRLGMPFLELDELIEDEAGFTLAQIFELHGGDYYRRLEREVLNRLLNRDEECVLATGGGIVTAPETWALLRRRAFTVWLKASPEEHWERVVRQGDPRPMRGLPDAMSTLRRLWETRAPMYAEADLTVETAAGAPREVVERLAERLGDRVPSVS